MAKIDKQYHRLLITILKDGRFYNDPNRKGVKRLQIPHYSFTYDLKDGFPSITTKKLYWKGVVGELLWFLKGETNIKYLVDNDINIWNKDAYNYYLKECILHGVEPLSLDKFIDSIKNTKIFNNHFIPNKSNYKLGNVGRIYGAQWRRWLGNSINFGFGDVEHSLNYIDQISNLIKNLKEKPLSTEHIVTAWNPAELNNMALPPCHKGFQLMVYELRLSERLKIYPIKGHLSEEDMVKYLDKYNIPKYGFDLVWEQRSVDTFLGLPFNIASYALLAHIIGKIVNMVPGKIIGDLRNVHIYDNAIDGVKEQLFKDVDKYDKCNLLMEDTVHYITDKELVGEKTIDEIINSFKISNFILENYESEPSINVKMLSRDE